VVCAIVFEDLERFGNCFCWGEEPLVERRM
jgi:hypothetical protein